MLNVERCGTCGTECWCGTAEQRRAYLSLSSNIEMKAELDETIRALWVIQTGRRNSREREVGVLGGEKLLNETPNEGVSNKLTR